MMALVVSLQQSTDQAKGGDLSQREAMLIGQATALQPWNQSIGPQSAKGKAAAARNAWTGGHAAKLRQLVKELNQAMWGQRDWLG